MDEREYHRRWYVQHREEQLAKQKIYRRRNAVAVRERNAKYRRDHAIEINRRRAERRSVSRINALSQLALLGIL